ncbi:hypothetical protein J3459_009837 [Metarhizium acridum]|nr:hypothetical protein J3459_009837 [Metarhizium acridum]
MSGIEIAGLVLAGPGIVRIFSEIAEKIHDKMKKEKKMKEYAQDLGKFLDDGKAQVSRHYLACIGAVFTYLFVISEI